MFTRHLLFAGAFAAGLLAAAPVQAAFTIANVTNSNGGDGFAEVQGDTFLLYGSDNAAGPNYTTALDIAPTALLLQFEYSFTSFDENEFDFDLAGYVINGVRTLLTPQASGRVTFDLMADDRFGFFVLSLDSVLGRAVLAVEPLQPGAIPEPASWAMMIAGFGLVGGLLRRRRAAPRVAI